jgi:hypothetical protein
LLAFLWLFVCLFAWGGLGEGLRVDETMQNTQIANKQTTKTKQATKQLTNRIQIIINKYTIIQNNEKQQKHNEKLWTIKTHEKQYKSNKTNQTTLHSNKKQWQLEAGGVASMPAFVTNKPNKQTNKQTKTNNKQTNEQQRNKETHKQTKQTAGFVMGG